MTACVSNIVAIITATTAGRRCKGTKMRCIIATYIVVRVSMNGILHRTSTVARYFMILARTFLVFSSTPWPFRNEHIFKKKIKFQKRKIEKIKERSEQQRLRYCNERKNNGGVTMMHIHPQNIGRYPVPSDCGWRIVAHRSLDKRCTIFDRDSCRH